MHRFAQFFCTAAAVALLSTQVQADLYWLGGTGNLLDNNYSNGTTSPLTPTNADIVFLGNGGTVTHSVTGNFGIQKLRVGHNQATPGGQGAATFTINNGAILSLSAGGTNAAASLWVGNDNNGVLNIDGANTALIAGQVAQIGWGNNLNGGNASGVVNITNGGEFTVQAGNTNISTFNGT